MKRMGNLVGAGAPQPDWNQTDAGMADFIRNKPDMRNYLSVTEGATKTYVDSRRFTCTAQIGTVWTDKVCEAAVPGLQASDCPHVAPVYSGTEEETQRQHDAWALVSEAEAGNGKIVFRCFDAVPDVAIPIQVEVMR